MLSALKNFGITFLISALLFGVVAFFATGFVTDTVGNMIDAEKDELNDIIKNPTGETTDININPGTSSDEKIPDGYGFAFLIITTDYRPDIYDDYMPTIEEMEKEDQGLITSEETVGYLTSGYREKNISSLVLVVIDKEKREFVYTYISPDTRVYTSSGYRTLREVYKYYGLSSLSDHVNAICGINPRYDLLIEGYKLKDFVDSSGSVNVNLGSDIYSTGRYYTMKYDVSYTYAAGAGTVELSADNLYALSAVKEESVSELKIKEAYSTEAVSKYIERFAAFEKEDFKYLLNKFVGTSEESVFNTNFTMSDFDNLYEMFGACEYFEKKTISYPCKYNAASEGRKAYFDPDLQSAIDLFKEYRSVNYSVNK